MPRPTPGSRPAPPSQSRGGAAASYKARSASARPAIMSLSNSAVHKAALREDVARDAAARSRCPSRSCWIAVAALMATFITHNLKLGSGRAAMGCNNASSIGGSKSCARSSSVSRETNQPRAPDVVDRDLVVILLLRRPAPSCPSIARRVLFQCLGPPRTTRRASPVVFARRGSASSWRGVLFVVRRGPRASPVSWLLLLSRAVLEAPRSSR